MKRNPFHFLSLNLFLAASLLPILPCRATSYTWTNTAGGNWSVAANWSPNGIPGGADSAAITTTGNYIVTNNAAQAIGTLTLGSSSGDGTIQSLNNSSTFTVNNPSTGTAQGTLNLSGGALYGAGALTLAGPLNWTGGTITNSITFKGGTLNNPGGLNGGTLINTGTLAWTPYPYTGGGSVISNASTAIINIILGNNPITQVNYAGTATFYNAGQINISHTGFNGTINDLFINTGTVNVSSGTLLLGGGGTNSGTFSIASGAILETSAGYNFQTGANFSGIGTLILNSGTTTFNPAASINTATLVVTIGGGTITGAFTCGALTWSSGTITGAVTCNGGNFSNPGSLNGGTLINTGTLAWPSYPYTGNGSVISNASTGIINVTLNNNAITQVNYAGTATFYNAGQINVSHSGFNGVLADTFINTGAVTVTNGTFELTGTATNTGSVNIMAGGTFQVASAYYINPGSVITGAGIFQLSSGSANFNAGSAFAMAGVPMTISGGTLTGTVSCGLLTWTSGTITGTVICNGGNFSNPGSLNGGTLINTGTIAWLGYPYTGNGSVISNASTGIINVTLNNNAITQLNYAGTATFYNAGQINVSHSGFNGTLADTFLNTGTGTVTITNGTFELTGGGTNTGAVNIMSGGTFQVASTYYINPGSVISGAGIFQLSSGSANFNAGSAFAMAGVPVTISGGTLNGTVSCGPLTWNSGTIAGFMTVNGGNFSNPGGLNGGTLINTGTIAWPSYPYTGNGSVISNASTGIINVTLNNNAVTQVNYAGTATFYNAGQINVAHTGSTGNLGDKFINTGTLTINSGTLTFGGSYSLTNGVVNFGLDSSTVYGKLALPGNPAPLAGTISAILNSNYIPLVNAAFPVITFNSSAGAFTGTNLPPIAVWQTAYNAANITLTVLKWIPQFTWPNPANIVYGTLLSGTQLDAIASSPTNLGVSLPGILVYTPPVGTALLAGNNETLTVTITPTDLVNYTNASTNVSINVLPAPLTVTATNQTKTYGQTKIFAGTEFTTSGLLFSDSVTSVTLASPGAAATATVAGSPYTITNSAAVGPGLANYTITYVNAQLAVNPAPLVISSGISANNKLYDRTTLTTLATNVIGFATLFNGDAVNLITNGYTANFPAPGVGNALAVTIGGLTLGGTGAGNYTLTQPAGLTANITTAPVTITSGITANNKVYNQTTTATLTSNSVVLSGVVTGDTVTLNTNGYIAVFGSAAAANGVAVNVGNLTLSGAAAANYALTQPAGLTANITAAPVTISSGLTANNKLYDKTTVATLSSNNVVLAGVIAGDTATLNTNGYTATFASASVGTGIAVNVSGLTLGGASAPNYSLTQPTSLTANIGTLSLQIAASLPNVIISWPTNANGFVLNISPTLTPQAWTPITAGIVINGTNNTFTTNAAGFKFYSLISP